MEEKQQIGKVRRGWGTRGRKMRLSVTDCSLQRVNIKPGKYRYQMLNKVAAVRYWMQKVCFCVTWCNTLFSAISSGCKANEEPSLIGWIPKQITSRQISGAGLPGDWLQAQTPGFALLFDWLHHDYHPLCAVVICLLAWFFRGFTASLIIKIEITLLLQ